MSDGPLADPKAQKRNKQKDLDARRQRVNDIRNIMGVTPGRRLLWSILEAAGLDRESFNGDAQTTAFLEGRRSVAVVLNRDLKQASPSLWAAMHRERIEAEADAAAATAEPEEPVVDLE